MIYGFCGFVKKNLHQTGLPRDSARTQVHGFGRSQASKAVWENRKAVEKYSKYHYNKDGTIVVTDDWTTKKHPHIDPQYRPFAVIETLSQNGAQYDRSYFDVNGILVKQINGGPHGNVKKHPFGKHGEHKHDIELIDGKIVRSEPRELNDFERKENADIL